MDDGFGGFPARAFEWFEGLERDNSREYFGATRAVFDADVRGAFEALLDELAEGFAGDAAVKVFRQHRDLRFSPDKSPYKTRTYGVVTGVAELGGGGYAELSARGLYAGTGSYAMARDQLERYRAAVDADAPGEELGAIVRALQDAGLDVEGQGLATAPRGYPRDHPRVALLRHKSLIAGRRLAPRRGRGIGRAAALEHVGATWRAAIPLNAWLRAHVGPSALPDAGRGRRR